MKNHGGRHFYSVPPPCPPPHLRPHQAKASCGPVCMLLVKRTSINVSYSM